MFIIVVTEDVGYVSLFNRKTKCIDRFDNVSKLDDYVFDMWITVEEERMKQTANFNGLYSKYECNIISLKDILESLMDSNRQRIKDFLFLN